MATTTIQLNPGKLLRLGRSKSANHAFPFDDFMSRLHFSIERRDRGAIVRDLRSKNGTFLNHKRVYFGRLQDGDLIVAGSTFFRFTILSIEEANSRPEHPGNQDITETGNTDSADEETLGQHSFHGPRLPKRPSS